MITRLTGRVGSLLVVLLIAGACTAGPGATPQSLAPTTSQISSPAQPVVSPTPVAPMSPDAFWAGLFSGEPDAVTYPSVGELIKGSDAVVLASFVGVTSGPNSDAGSGYTNYMATVTLQVDRVLHGSLRSGSGTVPLAVFLGVGPAGTTENPYAAFIKQMITSMPHERGVLFMVNMAAYYQRFDPDASSRYDPSAYQVTSSQGLVRDVAGVAQPPSNAPGAWPMTFKGRPFDDVLSEIASVKPGP